MKMEEPRLYILMRTDMDSMNPGKGMAQAAHAANQFIHECGEQEDWSEGAMGFGTTIVLAVDSEDHMNDCMAAADAFGLYNSVVHDPSYPVRDGNVIHLVPVDTCAYVYVDFDQEVPEIVRNLSLHP